MICNRSIGLEQVVKNFSLFSFEALNIICEKKQVEINSLRDKNGLDLLTNYILNGENHFIEILKEQNYPLDGLLNITEGLELSDYSIFIPFKNDRKESISLKFNPPITSKLTSLHLLVFLLFKNQQQAIDSSNFKFALLTKNLLASTVALIDNNKILSYKDSEGYSVSDYICMFPTVETLNLLIEKDKNLSSLCIFSLPQIPKLLKSYHDELLKNNNYSNIVQHIDTLIFQNELDISCSVNNSNSASITKF